MDVHGGDVDARGGDVDVLVKTHRSALEAGRSIGS